MDAKESKRRSAAAAASSRVANLHRHLASSEAEAFAVARAPTAAVLADEYGTMDSRGETYIHPLLRLDSGKTLRDVAVRYRTYGALNAAGTNCVVICHALTGNASVEAWWNGMVGEGAPVDLNDFFVVCANVLGSWYGTCGPTSVNPDTGKPYGASFPHVTVRDSVRLHAAMLSNALGVKEVFCAIGGSMGGMQALEWTFVQEPTVRAAVILSCGGRHTPWQIGVSELQRQAIYADPKFRNGRYPANDPPNAGISVARQIAMVSYRTHHSYATKFGRARRKEGDGDGSESATDKKAVGPAQRAGDPFQVETYLRHQGQKFIKRAVDANSYIVLTQLMDSHDVSRARYDSYLEALNSIRVPLLVVGITSDVLYPIVEQKELAEHCQNAELHLIPSDEGHDGFLLEQKRIGPLVSRFLKRRLFETRTSRIEEDNVKLRAELAVLKRHVTSRSPTN